MQFTRERKLNAFSTFLGANGVDPALAFVHPIGIRMAEKPIEKLAPLAAPYTSDTGELVYDKAGRTYIIRAAKAAIRPLSGQRVTTDRRLEAAWQQRQSRGQRGRVKNEPVQSPDIPPNGLSGFCRRSYLPTAI
jgi:hypothetical protein